MIDHFVTPLVVNTSGITNVVLKDTRTTFDPSTAQDLVSSGWDKATTTMAEKGWPFYDGQLYRFEGAEIADATLHLAASSSNRYSHVIGLRAHAPEHCDHLEANERPNALSAINVIITSDDCIVMPWRASGDWDESYELSGGFVLHKEQSISESALMRIKEDLSLAADEIALHSFFALVHYPRIFETMSIFTVRLNLSASELRARIKNHPKFSKVLIFPFAKQNWEEIQADAHTPLHPPSKTILDFVFKASR